MKSSYYYNICMCIKVVQSYYVVFGTKYRFYYDMKKYQAQAAILNFYDSIVYVML